MMQSLHSQPCLPINSEAGCGSGEAQKAGSLRLNGATALAGLQTATITLALRFTVQ